MTANVVVHGFGMKVTAWSADLTQKKTDKQAKPLGPPAGSFTAVGSKQELLQRADTLTIHYVLSEHSHDIVGPIEANGAAGQHAARAACQRASSEKEDSRSGFGCLQHRTTRLRQCVEGNTTGARRHQPKQPPL